jgi:aspartyl aminopeptidase
LYFQAAVVGGAFNEFIFSARLDNLLMSYVAIEALCVSVTGSGMYRTVGCESC